MLTALECVSYSRRAATEQPHAAGVAHAKKLKTYTDVLRTGDVLLSVSVEIHGGGHASLRAKLQQEEWARLTSDGSLADASRVLRILQQRLSMALMRTRVGYVQAGLFASRARCGG